MVLKTAESFWKLVSKERFLKLKNFTLKCTQFGNTLYEDTFSTMKQVKSKNRNRMADERLDDSLQIAPLTLVLIKE